MGGDAARQLLPTGAGLGNPGVGSGVSPEPPLESQLCILQLSDLRQVI